MPNMPEEEEQPKLKIFDTVIENTEMVDKLYEERPDARKKKLFKEWENEIYHYMKQANTLAGFKIYGSIV